MWLVHNRSFILIMARNMKHSTISSSALLMLIGECTPSGLQTSIISSFVLHWGRSYCPAIMSLSSLSPSYTLLSWFGPPQCCHLQTCRWNWSQIWLYSPMTENASLWGSCVENYCGGGVTNPHWGLWIRKSRIHWQRHGGGHTDSQQVWKRGSRTCRKSYI